MFWGVWFGFYKFLKEKVVFGKIEGKEELDIIKLIFFWDKCILLDSIFLIKIFFLKLFVDFGLVVISFLMCLVVFKDFVYIFWRLILKLGFFWGRKVVFIILSNFLKDLCLVNEYFMFLKLFEMFIYCFIVCL